MSYGAFADEAVAMLERGLGGAGQKPHSPKS
jgi:hypothetical protein